MTGAEARGSEIRFGRAIVTGASSGIGAAFARAIAAQGDDLVLVARRAERLAALADELRAAHGVDARVVAVDLAEPTAVGRLVAATDGLEIGLLVNNAGFGTRGAFAREDDAEVQRELAVNVAALVGATRAFLPAMLDRGRGAVVNLASNAAYQPVPGMAVYAATKAFVRAFSEALWYETRGSGVRVLQISPGTTSTEFFDRIGRPTAMGGTQSPEEVVALALRTLAARWMPPGRVSGRINAVAAGLTRLVPRRMLVAGAARTIGFRPGR